MRGKLRRQSLQPARRNRRPYGAAGVWLSAVAAVVHRTAGRVFDALRRAVLPVGATDDYYGNYGYLDGHAEGKHYKDLKQYLEQFHPGIPQSWNGVDFYATYQPYYSAIMP